jgi:glycosyltransferase involved in cell wall biosynthesis
VAGRLAGADAIFHHLHGTESYGWRQRLFEQSFPADAYLACSGAVRDHFQKAVGKLPVEVLYNPIDTDQYRASHDLRREGRKLLEISDDRPVILTIGRFVPEKGQGCLIDAISSVLVRHPNALFVFIGDGPEREKIEQRGKSLHGSVRFLGRQMDPLPYFNACDLYVQPSLGRE